MTDYSHKTALQLLANYNQWMNQKLIEVLRPLKPEALWKDRGAFFGSVMGTLNHLMVADILWCKRLANHPSGQALVPIEGYAVPAGLDSVLYEHLNDYIPARQALDDLIISYINSLEAKALGQPLAYMFAAKTRPTPKP